MHISNIFRKVLLVISLIASNCCHSQNCAIQNPIVFDAKYIQENNIDYISKLISDAQISFTDIQTAEINLQLKKCNSEINNKIAEYKSQYQKLSSDKQELLKVKDIQKIKEQIIEKNKSLEKIQNQIEADLHNVSFKGIYIVCLKNINPLNDTKEKLSGITDSILSPRAIKELNGTFIKSLTELKDGMTISDNIKSHVSGEMTIDKALLSRINPKQRCYINLSKVDVSPLKERFGSSNNNTITQDNASTLIINVLSQTNYKELLSVFGLNNEIINELELEINTATESLFFENNQAKQREIGILQKGENNINQVKTEIAELNNQLLNRREIVKSTIENKTNLKFDDQNSDACINKAVEYFENKMDEVKNFILNEKGNELLSRNEVAVPTEGVAAKEIAKKAIEVCNQLEKTHSKIERFIQIIETKNAIVENFNTNSDQDLYRSLEKIWLFPVPGEKDDYKLTVVVKFKVNDLLESNDKKEGSVQIEFSGANSQENNNSEKPVFQEEILDNNKHKNGLPNSIKNLLDSMVLVNGGRYYAPTWPNGYRVNKLFEIEPFKISSIEITVDMYQEYCKAKGLDMPLPPAWGWKENHPIVNVTYVDAQNFCKWLTELTGMPFRLPRRTEWCYAAHGGNKSKSYKYSGGNRMKLVGWYYENSKDKWSTSPVALKKANEIGLYDMNGNVHEYSSDSGYLNEGGSWKSERFFKIRLYNDAEGGMRIVGTYSDQVGFRIAMSSN